MARLLTQKEIDLVSGGSADHEVEVEEVYVPSSPRPSHPDFSSINSGMTYAGGSSWWENSIFDRVTDPEEIEALLELLEDLEDNSDASNDVAVITTSDSGPVTVDLETNTITVTVEKKGGFFGSGWGALTVIFQ